VIFRGAARLWPCTYHTRSDTLAPVEAWNNRSSAKQRNNQPIPPSHDLWSNFVYQIATKLRKGPNKRRPLWTQQLTFQVHRWRKCLTNLSRTDKQHAIKLASSFGSRAKSHCPSFLSILRNREKPCPVCVRSYLKCKFLLSILSWNSNKLPYQFQIPPTYILQFCKWNM